MERRVLALYLLLLVSPILSIADEQIPALSDKPQWQRMLQDEDAKKATDLEMQISAAEQADSYAEAIKLHKELLALRTVAQGADHWQTTDEKWELDAVRKIATLPIEQRAGFRKASEAAKEAAKLREKDEYANVQTSTEEYRRWCVQVFAESHPRSAAADEALGVSLCSRRKFSDARPYLEKSLELRVKLLGPKHPDTAQSYGDLASCLFGMSKYADAEPYCRNALDISREMLGEKHRSTASCYNILAMTLKALGKYREAQPLHEKALNLSRELLGELHSDTAIAYHNLADNLLKQAKYADAHPFFQTALDINRKLFGETSLQTAISYNNLAMSFYMQEKYADSEPLHRRTLEIRLELLGEKDVATAVAYNDLGVDLLTQGKFAEARPLLQKALHVRRELLGESHRDTVQSYHNLGDLLRRLGNYVEAEPLIRSGLAAGLRLFGEKHPDTEWSYTVLAEVLEAQRRRAEALPLRQNSLRLCRELFGEAHPLTAAAFSKLAICLGEQGKHSEAEPFFRAALDARIIVFGEKHLLTVKSFSQLGLVLIYQEKHDEAEVLHRKAVQLARELFGENDLRTADCEGELAFSLCHQRKYLDAEMLDRKVLEIRLDLLGEKHSQVALAYNNLAFTLIRQGKYAQAQPFLEKSLDLRIELLGETHPWTARGFINLADNLVAQQKYADAKVPAEKAAASYEACRAINTERGFDRSIFGANLSPYFSLSLIHARLGAASDAWTAIEANTGRGLSDEVAYRRRGTFADADQARRITLDVRRGEANARILALVSKEMLTNAEEEELQQLRDERGLVDREFLDLAIANSQREIASLVEVQSAIRADTALVIIFRANEFDKTCETWGCVVRASSGPHWEILPGNGPDDRWTKDDFELPRKLRDALAEGAPAGNVAELSRRLYRQSILPLEKHLHGITRLLFTGTASIPFDVLTDKYTISYIPSSTFLARLGDRPKPAGRSLLAVGDPVLPSGQPVQELPLPPGGLLITQIVPGGNAANAGLRRDDVLLAYAGAELTSLNQAGELIAEHGQDAAVTVKIWRDGKAAERQVRPGKLGVGLDPRPAPEVIAAKRNIDQVLAALKRGSHWKELPGTAVEVAGLAKLAGDGNATVLTRTSASERELEQLRASGKLEQFRYLHFATHGEPNNAKSFESALILSQDQISDEIPLGGGKFYDGKLTANEVLENWQLNADLVTLSACESALGRPGGGDGLLGFAQAFLLAGARSVCLSLWKVDDTATALLMERFYQNLLGKREGLSQPMPKAEALAEAKHWLRDLTLDEAAKLTAEMTKGVARGKDEPALELVVPTADSASAKSDNHPFAHPRYWAAFILIGDPN